uniref:Uncharacterized protein n=1 Tax=Desertifilum tharense IPPAS B-1220 TaxID=1781255 RepID=A0ACD5GZ63_9CYAN
MGGRGELGVGSWGKKRMGGWGDEGELLTNCVLFLISELGTPLRGSKLRNSELRWLQQLRWVERVLAIWLPPLF